ncbi:MAG: cation:proton antiporter, partial [Clostridia bacterium]|nr:cation:proton antiporter [Clostridia bacterium]
MIFVLSRALCAVCKRLHIPFVVGELLAGVLIGLIKFIPGQDIITGFTESGLSFFAKIGVILIMFSAGLGTDIKMVKSTGKAAVIVTLLGVAVPIGFGFLTACLFLNHGFAGLTSAQAVSYFFYGVILTATSVSVTVATLKEMGKLNGKVGTTIVTAAILDDIIGVILLSFAAGLGGEGGNVGIVILKTVIFFVVAIPLGFLL